MSTAKSGANMAPVSPDAAEPYLALEASLHLNRYLAAKTLCREKRVLDLGCGEGYGAALLSRWGASSVVGVDIASDSLERARSRFGSDKVSFRPGDVQRLEAEVEEGQFDLALSLELIEHLDDPTRMLKGLRRAVGPGGTIILSCPNDHWHYPTPDKRNPCHRRKYTFDQFRFLAEAVLGPATGWFFGTPLVGFCHVPVESMVLGRQETGPMAIFEGRSDVPSLMLPTEEGISGGNCNYFLGVWGARELEPISVVFHPASMDSVSAVHRQAELSSLRQESLESRSEATRAADRAAAAEKVADGLRIKNEALAQENELLREELVHMRKPLAKLATHLRFVSKAPRGVVKLVIPKRVRAAVNVLIGRGGEG